MLDVLHRSQRGRVCTFRKGDDEISTPYVVSDDMNDKMHISSEGSRILSFFGTSVKMDDGLLLSPDIEQTSRYKDGICVVRSSLECERGSELYVMPNGFELRNDTRSFLRTLSGLRRNAGYNSLVYVSGAAEPSNLALLMYMGIDIVDDTLCRAYGKAGIRCIPEGHLFTGEDESENNILEMERECETVKKYIVSGRLRELVDIRAPSSPFNVALLRLLDKDHYGYIEESCETTGSRFACNTTQSLFRPEVKRFRERIINEYRKPEHKKVLVLLPCSAKKPYHISRSHRAFSSAIHTGPHDVFVHEVIVTSPLGAVPRELDVFFPANSYDIPVTGEWKCQEKEFIRSAVKSIIDQGYDKIISHMGDPELLNGLGEMTETCVGDPTSPMSLTNLETEVRNAAKGYGEPSYSVDRIENIHSVLSYQFGKEIAAKIMDGTHVIGKFPYWKLFCGKTQIGMLTPERQMVSLTLEGSEILAECSVNVVEMLDFELKGSLFAVGVTDADPRIRIGDECVIMLNGTVKGVGVAMMSGPEMKDLKRGVAVKMRHKA